MPRENARQQALSIIFSPHKKTHHDEHKLRLADILVILGFAAGFDQLGSAVDQLDDARRIAGVHIATRGKRHQIHPLDFLFLLRGDVLQIRDSKQPFEDSDARKLDGALVRVGNCCTS